MRTQVLDKPAARAALVARGLLDWQAGQVLDTARTYGLVNFTYNDERSVMGVKFIDGYYHLGDADFTTVKKG